MVSLMKDLKCGNLVVFKGSGFGHCQLDWSDKAGLVPGQVYIIKEIYPKAHFLSLEDYGYYFPTENFEGR